MAANRKGMHMTQLQQLAEPFPPHLVKDPPKGQFGKYVPHSAVTERLLAVVGPFSTKIERVIQDDDGNVVGCVLQLECQIDDKRVFVQEVGDADNPGGRKNNGALLKDAASDAIKRCAMRLGLGLHLWSQDDYFLFTELKKKADDE
jgi:hypothetical protein